MTKLPSPSAERKEKLIGILDEFDANAELLLAEAHALPWYAFFRRQQVVDKMKQAWRGLEIELMMLALSPDSHV
jgi:hypothetical protein